MVEAVDPLADAAWDEWVARQPAAEFFHGSAWARVLRDTYGHRPVYQRIRDSQGQAAALPLMEVKSWLTGRRGIALPFTDFCNTLGGGPADQAALQAAAMAEGRRAGWRYLERRGSSDGWPDAPPSLSFWGHTIDLTGGPGRLRENLGSAPRRALRKAEKAGLKVEFRTDAAAMGLYYNLHCRTRRRHGLPPQSWGFFSRIQRGMAETGSAEIGLVMQERRAIAGSVYFWAGKRALYKFGASDRAAQEARPNNLLMWRAVERFAEKGFETLHLGRTSLSNEGLRRFKLGFGAREEKIHYHKFDFAKNAFVQDVDKVEGWYNQMFARLPLFALKLAGKLLYPHVS
ncbi:MAG TPA: GNAT family N-acetyltransferase [Verrucomicrobiae bacterium]|jgi:lipid II:glycine glycyltransferase (peptidoglycan interpeptide bridge formation enzyme)|nr:GNAT family N-acetyltransferase [Verrucomicrobiae bacterium]